MAILKKEYELSVWDETLGEKGQKEEIKRAIIGAHDMDYLGRATSLKLSRKINGTNTLTFQLPSKYFDSELGEYIHNEFCDYLFNERKLKLKYDGEWFEFYVKSVSESKQFKSIMYQYSCEDAFIDELSRNGYGITFDTELYNNVEEIGIFTEQILEDSIWEYDASKNWGDFTEYAEEKLFKIPASMFKTVVGHKLNYEIKGELRNVYTGQTRPLELGDDLARERSYFWDNGAFDNGVDLLSAAEPIENDGYIYVPYSCLGFCYTPEEEGGYAATETAKSGTLNNVTSYYLAPQSIDPTSLIQFIAIPRGAEVQIDEAGLLVNKNYSYVMTLKEWNENVNTNFGYNIEGKSIGENLEGATVNKIVCYEGYLEEINDIEVTFGKKISITDRTEINISEDIDQYVIVYNNKQNEYDEMFTSEEWIDGEDYRICSYERTRVIVPQLARNLIQNGTEISDTSGWDVMRITTEPKDISSSISLRYIENESDNETSQVQGLILDASFKLENNFEDDASYRTFLNFGITGQEEKIEKDQTYVLAIDGKWVTKTNSSDSAGSSIYEDSDKDRQLVVIIGEGGYNSDGDYFLSKTQQITFRFEPFANKQDKQYYFIRSTINIDNPYFAIRIGKDAIFNLTAAQFFKAYTKGSDFFIGEEIKYKYTGRDIFFNQSEWIEGEVNLFYRKAESNEFLLETDIVEGDAYAYRKYFRQQLQYLEDNVSVAKDTFKLKSYLNNEVEFNGLDPIEYTEDDYKIVTDYIDLNKCSNYNYFAGVHENDCNHPQGNGVCMYQKYGYCPHLFQTQKHCRKIRTLNGEKSNRFNLTQELSGVFEVYPVYYIEHEENGKIVKDSEGKMIKKVFYITEKGMENKLGFRYEKNLSNISRTFDSKQIVTKLYVEDVDSELSKTGLCSIKTAEDNPSKDSYIIDFSYYTLKGLLDKSKTDADLYGIDSEDLGYLKTLGYYNGKYDELSNKIINLQDESFTELAANIEVNLTGIETAQQEMNKIKKSLSRYAQGKQNTTSTENVEENDTYKSYKIKYNEQRNILLGLIESTFMNDGNKYGYFEKGEYIEVYDGTPAIVLDLIDSIGFKTFKKEYLDTFKYRTFGMMGQYTAEYLQIQEWKKERAKYLKKINEISLAFYQKYEPYLKEGTWSDSNYLSDNSYYFGAKEVAKQGAIPKITYNISVVDLAILDSDYIFNIADTTYIEDIETFGINPKTGLPNRLKVIISGITYDLDTPSQNSIEIQNYTSQFEDLFQQVTASVQSLSFNENIYKRSSNFTSTQNVSGESLQGGLSENQLTLLETDENNLQFDYTGQHGSDINNHNNKYKLDGQGLFFSNNGGQSWNVGVTPKGINADYINVGTLDASKIQIVDGNYLYFLWDKSGITAYRSPQATKGNILFQDFAKFNKYGLSLVENGQVRLRAGYEYVGNSNDANGKFDQEADITSGTPMGFYLYDDKGQAIFKTESTTEYSARISLGGEMFVSDKLITTTQNPNEYSNIALKTTKYTAYSFIGILDDDEYKNYILSLDDGEIDFYSVIESIILAQDSTVEASKYYEKTFSNEESNLHISEVTVNKGEYFYSGDNFYSGKKINVTIIVSKIIEEETIISQEIREYCYNNKVCSVLNDTRILALSTDFVEETYSTYNSLEETNSVEYFVTPESSIELKEMEIKTINKKMYLRNMNSDTFIYYSNLIQGNEDIQESEEDNIGIFINNKKVTDTPNTNTERLFSCVKLENNEYKNIFSILDDGSLYIGGTAKELSKKEKENTLSNFADEVSIEKDENTILLGKNGIEIGDLNIQDYVEGKIDEIVTAMSNMGLITHNHDIGRKEIVINPQYKVKEGFDGYIHQLVTNNNNENNVLASTIKEVSFSGRESMYSLLDRGHIGITTVAQTNTGYLYQTNWIPLKTFFNLSLLPSGPLFTIKEGMTTENTGTAVGGVSSASYYVEEDI